MIQIWAGSRLIWIPHDQAKYVRIDRDLDLTMTPNRGLNLGASWTGTVESMGWPDPTSSHSRKLNRFYQGLQGNLIINWNHLHFEISFLKKKIILGWAGSRTRRIGGCWVGGTASSACHNSSSSTCATCSFRQTTYTPGTSEKCWGGWACSLAGRNGTLIRSSICLLYCYLVFRNILCSKQRTCYRLAGNKIPVLFLEIKLLGMIMLYFVQVFSYWTRRDYMNIAVLV